MKEIINRKVYDTDRGVEIGIWSNKEERWSRRFEYKVLFKKRSTGEYFLYIWGGSDTKYFEEHGGCKSAGERIVPLSANEAYNFAITHFSDEACCAEFKNMYLGG